MRRNKPDSLRVLAVLVIIFGILYFYGNLFLPRKLPRSIRIGVIRQPMNILVLGTDINFNLETGKPVAAGEGRTDSILLLHVDPARFKMTILSIPRDSFVDVPGFGLQKINSANVLGNTELVKRTITGLTGVNVDHVIKVNPYAAIRLIDLLGGVIVDVEDDMYYVDNAQKLNINLKKGRQRLSGLEAEGYFRFRHDALGDIGRIGRQQKLLETIFRSFTSPANLVKAPMAFEISSQYIWTDLPLIKIIRLANYSRMLSPADIKTFVATGEESTSDYAGMILVPNRVVINDIVRHNFQ